MNEIPVLFGPESTLVGVVCKPSDELAKHNLAFLTFNAGVVPRIGPHRFNVKLSRALAADGVLSMRFDLGGLGDSRPAGTQQDFLQQAITDVRAAMDYLEQQHGIRRFVLIGNCSGAVHIYWTALADPRVAAILMFDGFWYRTRWSKLVRHWKRLSTGTWKGALMAITRRVGGLLQLARRKEGEAPAEIFASDESGANPPRADYCRDMQALVDRGVNVFLVFSGGVIDAYSYAGQFRDGFGKEPFFAKVRCDFLPQIDHTLLSLASQQLLIKVIRDWILDIVRAAAPSALNIRATRGH